MQGLLTLQNHCCKNWPLHFPRLSVSLNDSEKSWQNVVVNLPSILTLSISNSCCVLHKDLLLLLAAGPSWWTAPGIAVLLQCQIEYSNLWITTPRCEDHHQPGPLYHTIFNVKMVFYSLMFTRKGSLGARSVVLYNIKSIIKLTLPIVQLSELRCFSQVH